MAQFPLNSNELVLSNYFIFYFAKANFFIVHYCDPGRNNFTQFSVNSWIIMFDFYFIIYNNTDCYLERVPLTAIEIYQRQFIIL